MEYVQEGHGADILDLYGAVSKRLLLYVKTGKEFMHVLSYKVAFSSHLHSYFIIV